MGWFCALASVLLVSLAQLLLKWAMIQLPALALSARFGRALLEVSPPVLALLGGLLAYALSMLCWLLALRRLPLGRAYPLLSLSYVLVWAAALWLPGLNEVFHYGTLAGVGLILAGVLLVVWPQHKSA